ncbi:hypothetical protein [Actinocatenispora thailandica]|uniref:hypothetical protein n=1 Tax=Actinocatenispora thailandica TaxID=227318 RepID=UPI00195281F5|nr:hypothetical protein [Actinocatenispora thailandica]
MTSLVLAERNQEEHPAVITSNTIAKARATVDRSRHTGSVGRVALPAITDPDTMDHPATKASRVQAYYQESDQE